MDFTAVKRLVLSELAMNNYVKPQKICGFSRTEILNMSQNPERFGKKILKLMDYMYLRSGYMRRLINYFTDIPLLRYHVDTEVLGAGINETLLKKNYMKFCAQASKYNLSNVVHEITRKMYLHDVCFAYVEETDVDMRYFFLDPRYCEITKVVNGNVYQFAVNRNILNGSYFESVPAPLQDLIQASYETSNSNLVEIPYENALCLKYHSDFPYLFPPLFPMIADILLIDEYKDLAKTKAVNDAYKLLVLKLPTKDGMLTMGDDITLPFVSTALNVVQENIGVLPVPFETDSVEFSGSNADDRDKVSDAITWTFKNAGVSEALMSGASSGSELNLSITNDSGEIFAIYRMLENWVAFQSRLRKFIFKNYQFVYHIFNMTIFNYKDIVDQELRLAQSGLPNKSKLCAASGISPSAMIGNTIVECDLFGDLFDKWQPLRTSYVQSAEDSAGRPTVDDADLSESGEAARDNDTNLSDNRI